MMHKFTVLSGLVLSATCMVLHQPSLPVVLGLQYNDSPNYNFAYDVNDPHTGDIKSQYESRRGDTVLGQYSLVQPDGARRTVDYTADDHSGFQAAVNNDGGASLAALEAIRHSGLAVQSYQQRPAPTAYPSSANPSPTYPSSGNPSSAYSSFAYPSPANPSAYSSVTYPSNAYPSPANPSAYSSVAYPSTAYSSPAYPSTASTSGAVSRTSFVQTIARSPVTHNPWP